MLSRVRPEKKGRKGTQRGRRGVPREEGWEGDTEGVQGCAQRRRAGWGHRGCAGMCPEKKGRKRTQRVHRGVPRDEGKEGTQRVQRTWRSTLGQ